MKANATSIRVPEPTEVTPTATPPATPTATVRSGRATMAPPLTRVAVPLRVRTNRRAIAPAPETMSNAPITGSRSASADFVGMNAPERAPEVNAAGTDPTTIHFAIDQLTSDRLRWTAAATGRITNDATRSVATADLAFAPTARMRIGVNSAPPPEPVSPTTRPTPRPATKAEGEKSTESVTLLE